MFRKSTFTVILALLLVLGLVASASANPGKGNNGLKFKAKSKGNAVQLIDISSHWAEQPIREMCSIGIISGYPDKKFIPNAPVSKYEALMMVCRAAGFDPDPDKTWQQNCEDCIEFALDEGILDEDDDFAGWKPAKRYEVAVWSIRAIGLDEDGDELSFQDIYEIPSDALPFISIMSKHKYMVGYPGNFFQPNKPVTRAEMARILYNMMGEYPDYYDDSDLRLSSLDPRDGEDNVDPDTNVLVARFNMDIEAVDDLQDVKEGIRVKNVTDGNYVDIYSVSISGSELRIRLEDSLESNCKYRVTIKPDIIESEDSEESFNGISGSDWEFSTFDDENDDEVRLVSLDPDDGDSNVDPDINVLRAAFDSDISVISGKSLLSAVRVYNVSHSRNVAVDKVKIDGDTLIITLEDSLGAGDTFEVTIRPGFLEDDDSGEDFDGITGYNWRFTTD
jgi:hypothetical protein